MHDITITQTDEFPILKNPINTSAIQIFRQEYTNSENTLTWINAKFALKLYEVLSKCVW